MPDYGLIGGLGAGLQAGLQAYTTERQYQDKVKNDAFTKALQLKMAHAQLNPISGALEDDAFGKLKSQYDTQQVQSGIDDMSPDSATSKNRRGLVTGILNQAGVKNPGGLVGNQSAHELDKTEKYLNPVIAGEYGVKKERAGAFKIDKKDMQHQKDALAKHLDLGWTMRSGQAGNVQSKIVAAEAAEQLLAQGQSQQGGLDSRQIEELAQATGRLLGGGASASARVEALVPHTAEGKARSLQEWVTGKPTGQEMQEFTDRMAETVAREKALANDQKRQFQIEGLPEFGDFKEGDPKTYQAMLKSRGIEPGLIDENSRYKKPEVKFDRRAAIEALKRQGKLK